MLPKPVKGERLGARKKLVPSVSRENKCPHEYVDDDELRLEVDCEACHGPHDLTNRRCLCGIMQILCSGARPNVLILKRKTHKRYREDHLSLVLQATSALEAMNRCLSLQSGASDRRCQTCQASMSWIVGALRRDLLDDPLAFATDPEAALRRALRAVKSTRCEEAETCIERAASDWRRTWGLG